MKKNLLKSLSLLLLITLAMAGCQKNATEKIIPPASSPTKEAFVNAKQSGCKLVYENWPESFWQNFTFNQDGLIDRWRLVYPSSNYFTNTKITYHPNGHMKRADMHIMPGSLNEYAMFTYQGDNITKVEWRYTATNELDVENFITYNSNNQVTKFDMPLYNYYINFAYNAAGNVIHADFYSDNFLFAYNDWTYTDYIKNAELLLVSSGVPFDFISPWIQNYPQFPNGINQHVWNEESATYEQSFYSQPQNTTFTVNGSGYPEIINLFDEVAAKANKIVYNYANCGNGNQKQANLPEETGAAGNGKVLEKAERMKILKEIMMARMPKTGKGN